MNVYENIEKVYRVKGYTKTFETCKEAENYAREILLTDCIDSEKRAKIFCREYNAMIKECRMLAEEVKWNDEMANMFWEVKQECDKLFIMSKRANAKVPIAFKIDLSTKKGLHFARELVRYYCKEKIKLLQEQVRHQKNVVKEAQRDFAKLQGGK